MSPVSAADATADAGVKVIVASSRPAVVAAWVQRLTNKPGLCATGTIVSNSAALEAAIHRATPHVALLDVAALEWLSTEALERLRGLYSELRILLVCDSAGPQLAHLVLSHRLHGYLVSGDRELCVKAVFGVHRGELWLPRAVIAAALYGPQKIGISADAAVGARAKIVPKGVLTEREQDVANCLRRGSSNTEIARELGIRKDTAKKHVRRVLDKLGVRQRAQVALLREKMELDEPDRAGAPSDRTGSVRLPK